MIPKNGVYIVSSKIDNLLFYGMMNIGHNPTIGYNKKTIEIHFFNLNQDLYHKILTVTLLEYIRAEEKFDSIEALKLQLNNDRKFSFEFLNNHENISF